MSQGIGEAEKPLLGAPHGEEASAQVLVQRLGIDGRQRGHIPWLYISAPIGHGGSTMLNPHQTVTLNQWNGGRTTAPDVKISDPLRMLGRTPRQFAHLVVPHHCWFCPLLLLTC